MIKSGIRILSKYPSVASGSQSSLFDRSGNYNVVKDNAPSVFCKYLEYDNRMSVTRTATGFLLPLRRENLGKDSLKMITVITMTIR